MSKSNHHKSPYCTVCGKEKTLKLNRLGELEKMQRMLRRKPCEDPACMKVVQAQAARNRARISSEPFIPKINALDCFCLKYKMERINSEIPSEGKYVGRHG